MAAKRITPLQKQIFEAHLEAYKNNSWDYPDGFKGGIAEIMQALKDGKTIKGVWEQVVTRYVSITSQLYASPNVFGHLTDAYIAQTRKGFKDLLNIHGVE